MFVPRLVVTCLLFLSVMADADLDRVRQLKASKTPKGPTAKAPKGPKNPKVEKSATTKAPKTVKSEKAQKLAKAFKQIFTKAPTPAPVLPPLAQQTGNNQVTVIITTDDYPQETSFEVKNLQGQVYMAGASYTGQRTTYSDSKFVPNGAYQFILMDSFGDGLCCQFGPGGYNLFLNGNLVKAGGTFTSSETVAFTAGIAPPTNAPVNPTPKPVPTPTNKPVAPSAPGNCGGTTVIVTTDDYPLETSWTVKDLSGTQVMGVPQGTYTGPRTTYSSEQCLPYKVYQFMIMDQKGDGMCCNFGPGGWNLFVNGALVGSGGQYTSSQSVLFSSQGTPFTPPTAPIASPPTNVPTNVVTPAPTNAVTPAPTSCGSTTAIVTTDDFPLETSWNIKNQAGIQVMGVTVGTYTGVRTTYQETQCLPYGIYTFMIMDSKGDGICCGFGSGGYNLYANNVLIKAGGTFGTMESVTFNSDGSNVVPVAPPVVTPAPITAPTVPVAPTPPTPVPTNAGGPVTVASTNVQTITQSSNPGTKMTTTQQVVFCNDKVKEARRSPTIGDATVTCQYVDDVITTSRRRSLRFLQSTITRTVEFRMFFVSSTQSSSQLQTTSNDFPNQANTSLGLAETCSSLTAAGITCTAAGTVVPTTSAAPSNKPSVSFKPSGRPSLPPSGKPSKQPSGKPSGKPSRKPSGIPSGKPSKQPSGQPSGKPSSAPSGVSCAVESTAITQSTFLDRLVTYKATPTSTPAINTWNTQEVDDMSAAFQGFVTANPNVRCWDVAKVTNMQNMFNGATQFDIDISAWKVENVKNMAAMFKTASNFNRELSGWNADKVSDTNDMFNGAMDFNKGVPAFTNKVTDMSGMFQGALKFNQPINGLETSSVTDMSDMFNNANNFNSAIFPSTTAVKDFTNMFYSATSFNQVVNGWSVSAASGDGTLGMAGMFQNAQSFNQDVDSWTPILVKKFENMFNGASRFDGNIFAGAGAATTMQSMFQNAQSFNQDVDSLTPTLVTKFENMFNGASQFDGKIFAGTNAATTMTSMFEGASSFTGKNAENMVTDKVDNMQSMFKSAAVFNTAILLDGTKWDVAAVTTFANMFNGASSFNQNIANWAMPDVATGALTAMFVGASNFQQNLCLWNEHLIVQADTTSMFSSPKCPHTDSVFAANADMATAKVCCTCDGTVDTDSPGCA